MTRAWNEVFNFQSGRQVVSKMKRSTSFTLLTKASLLCILFSHQAAAEFPGAPDDRAGQFIRLSNTLDDPNRGFCIDIPGHMQGTDLNAVINVHTCKDGFWNYDERFQPEVLSSKEVLYMPAFGVCLTATALGPGADLKVKPCDPSQPNQRWQMDGGQLKSRFSPELCLTVDSAPSEVSIGTRNHPVRHLVRPLTLELCEEGSIYQQWQFTAPSDKVGIRYPDGGVRN